MQPGRTVEPRVRTTRPNDGAARRASRRARERNSARGESATPRKNEPHTRLACRTSETRGTCKRKSPRSRVTGGHLCDRWKRAKLSSALAGGTHVTSSTFLPATQASRRNAGQPWSQVTAENPPTTSEPRRGDVPWASVTRQRQTICKASAGKKRREWPIILHYFLKPP